MSMIPVIALGSAGLYALAMIGMKLWWSAPGPGIALLIIAAIMVGALLEMTALRSERLGLIYVSILGAEVILIAGASLLYFGESFSTREVAGIGFVLLGAALAWT
ncbi:hypothetical protein M3P21_07785 [Ruegeria sp. 2012CJ41-6]|uniref:Spermidine export protein MdtJ n=1 Tax=Ruegeria spongiae TaxID=2942209 RepID=A0ABT0Q0M2_9RHOB|nr:hypothetical protein [Ruegeria spongiae]MCL6283433.1 hypothetical protein [Ruegeria spongiae]